MNRSGVAVALTTALLLAGCAPEPSTVDPAPTEGSPSTVSASPAASESLTSAAPSDTPIPSTDSVEGIAQLIGLTGFAVGNPDSPYILRWGKGTLDGSEVRVYEFTDEEQFATYVDSVAAFGITADSFARMGNFAVAPTDAGQLEQIRASLDEG